MSVSPQVLMRKLSAESRESSDPVSKSDHSDLRFRELMQVAAIDDKPKEKDFFSIVEEEEKKEESVNDGQFSLPVITLHQALTHPEDEENGLLSGPILNNPALQQTGYENLCHRSVIPYVSSMSIDSIFEKMASAMIVMCSSNETETTLFLDNPHFASSVFFGSKIIIREFSTAPKTFNIEIASTMAGIACLEAGRQDLFAAFQKGNFNFSIHRLDTHLQNEDRPAFHRKEDDAEGRQQDQQGGRQ